MIWSYGVTTVQQRFNDLLPRTINSLKEAGFPEPVLFVDGHDRVPYFLTHLRAVYRGQSIGAWGNWILGMMELYLRNPTADRYAMFQDDVVMSKNSRGYLDRCEYPTGSGYWNLYTHLCNIQNRSGWYGSDQYGKGALGLVFDNEAMEKLLTTQHIIRKPKDANRSKATIDGAVIEIFKTELKRQELVHNPSLMQHTGKDRSIIRKGPSPFKDTTIFRGEDFDALSLLSKESDASS